MRVELGLKALGQSGKPWLLLMAVLCAAAALLGLTLLNPAAEPAAPPPVASAPPSDRQGLVEMRLRERVEHLIGTIVGRENVRAIVSAEIEPDQTRQVSEPIAPGTNARETTTIRTSGQIRRLTVSVMVNGSMVNGADGLRYRPRSDAELARYTRLARDAAGFDTMRGDSLTVETVRFAENTAPLPAGGLPRLASGGLIGVLGLAAVLLAVKAFSRNAPVAEQKAPEPVPAPAPPIAEAHIQDSARSPALRRAGDVVTTKPAAAAAVVRQWMSA